MLENVFSPVRATLTVAALALVMVSPVVAQAKSLANPDPNQVADSRYGWENRSDRYNQNDRRRDSYYRDRYYRDVNRAYRDVLGRTVDREGLRTWGNRLENGWSVDRLRRELARSSEARDAVDRLYREVLGRGADQSGLRTYTDRLADGWTLSQVRRELARSGEARNHGRTWNRGQRRSY